MRIIKDSPTVIQTIAGEMLNIESGLLLFIDGRLVHADTTPYEKYPRLIDGTAVYEIKSVCGYIYIPSSHPLEQFQQQIITHLLALIDTLSYEQRQHLAQYQTAKSGYCTNTKIRSSQTLTEASDSKRGHKNSLRQFITLLGDSRRGRFTWIVQHITDINFEVSSRDPTDAIGRLACGIVCDLDDIVAHPHNTVIYDANDSIFKGASSLTTLSVDISKHGHRLAHELSTHWKTALATPLRNLAANKQVYKIEYNLLTLQQTDIGGAQSDSICAKCKSVLWDDNYIMCGHIDDPSNPVCVCICPLCVHSSPADRAMEQKYFRVFRATFPKTFADITIHTDPERKELYEQVCARIVQGTITHADETIEYTLIGDKFAHVDQKKFMRTPIYALDIFKGRRIITARFV